MINNYYRDIYNTIETLSVINKNKCKLRLYSYNTCT